MKKSRDKRRSHCAVCGTRLSEKTEAGDIRWQPSQVDDKGIVCEACLEKPKKKGAARNTSRTKKK